VALSNVILIQNPYCSLLKILLLLTFFALPFKKFWKIKLEEILIYHYICLFYFLFLKGFIIENFNLLGKISLIRTFLHISLRGELMDSLFFITWWKFCHSQVLT